jgi:hypothetical protein
MRSLQVLEVTKQCLCLIKHQANSRIDFYGMLYQEKHCEGLLDTHIESTPLISTLMQAFLPVEVMMPRSAYGIASKRDNQEFC